MFDHVVFKVWSEDADSQWDEVVFATQELAQAAINHTYGHDPEWAAAYTEVRAVPVVVA